MTRTCRIAARMPWGYRRQMNAPSVGAEPGRGDGTRRVGDPTRMEQLAEQQAALRRVATLIAKGAGPADVFSVVADELGHLVGAEATFVIKVDLTEPAAAGGLPEGTCTVVAAYGRAADVIPPGLRT